MTTANGIDELEAIFERTTVVEPRARPANILKKGA